MLMVEMTSLGVNYTRVRVYVQKTLSILLCWRQENMWLRSLMLHLNIWLLLYAVLAIVLGNARWITVNHSCKMVVVANKRHLHGLRNKLEGRLWLVGDRHYHHRHLHFSVLSIMVILLLDLRLVLVLRHKVVLWLSNQCLSTTVSFPKVRVKL